MAYYLVITHMDLKDVKMSLYRKQFKFVSEEVFKNKI